MDKEAAKAALLTDDTLAERWGLSSRTIKRWRAEDSGKVPPSFLLGVQTRYRLDDVIAFEDARKNPGVTHGCDQESAGDTSAERSAARSNPSGE